MTDHVKHLPPAAIPAPGPATWNVPDTERWHLVRVPAVLAPVPGSRGLAVLALGAILLRAWSAPEPAGLGSAWRAYTEVALLLALPLWFRFLPVLALLSAPVLAVFSYASLSPAPAPETGDRFAYGLTVALCVCAAAGAAGRLLSRRLQRAAVLRAAGPARHALPGPLPLLHGRRGARAVLAGACSCLAGAAVLAHGLLADLDDGPGQPYDAFWQQFIALPLLLTGTTLLGRGLSARRAARRLHRAPQPALRVGVRTAPTGFQWLYPDADTPAARPLIGFAPGDADNHRTTRLLVSGSAAVLRTEHHDIDVFAEPFEAIVYGAPVEGAEVVLAYAVYEGDTRIVTRLTAARLLPYRVHRMPGPWKRAQVSHRRQLRAEEARIAKAVHERQQARAERARANASRENRPDSSGGCGGDVGCGDGGGCGGCS